MTFSKPKWDHSGQIKCPECGERIFLAANGVALDLTIKPAELCRGIAWQVTLMGTELWAIHDDEHATGQELHEHQPPEAVNA